MSSKSSSNSSSDACLSLIVIVLLVAFAVAKGLALLLQAALGIALLAAAVVILICIALIVSAFVLDIIRYCYLQLLRRWRRRRSIRNSAFPAHNRLQMAGTLDCVFWDMIDFYNGRKTRRTSVWGRRSDSRIRWYSDLRSALLHNRGAFADWRRRNILKVIDYPYNRGALQDIYGRLWRLVVAELQSGSPSSFTAVIFQRLARWETPRFLFFLPRGTFWNSRTRARVSSLSMQDDELQERILRRFTDSPLFFQFMHYHLFEILDQVGTVHVEVSDIHAQYHERARTEEHYKLRPLPIALPAHKQQAIPQEAAVLREREQRLERRKRQARREAEEWQGRVIEEHRLRNEGRAEAAYQALKEELDEQSLQDLRDACLDGRTAEIAVSELRKPELSPFEDAVQDVLNDKYPDSPRRSRKALKGLRRNRAQFQEFWSENERAILTYYTVQLQMEKRLREQETAKEAQQQEEAGRRRWIEEELNGAMKAYPEITNQIRNGIEAPLAHEKCGLLIAKAQLEVQRKTGAMDSETIDNFVQRELQALLEKPDAESFFSEGALRSIQYCNDFRQEALAWSSVVEEKSRERNAPLDALILAFHLHGQAWRSEYWKGTFRLVLEGRHEWQATILEVVGQHRSRSFQVFEDIEPYLLEIEEAVRRFLLDRREKREDAEEQL